MAEIGHYNHEDHIKFFEDLDRLIPDEPSTIRTDEVQLYDINGIDPPVKLTDVLNGINEKIKNAGNVKLKP